ncbi:hypothetical protein COLO4_00590 [Corchorus olitorius]|uniref:Uncharacterized protein n=1 Tax=Corchorus olitorius TaxID=93759 RepID=A0A1R3L3Q2_9ROSI|nr:hypothetical protein COLO4_00590 [Corchorus olitorius]
MGKPGPHEGPPGLVRATLALRQHAGNGVERSEDHDSIILGRPLHGVAIGCGGIAECAHAGLLAFAETGIGQRLGQARGARRARRGQIGQAPVVDLVEHVAEHTGDVLVLHRAEHRVGVAVEAHVLEVLTKRGRRVRVVGDVQDDGRTPRQHLETPRQHHLRQPQTHVLRRDRQPVAHRLQRCQRGRCIQQLVRPAQCRVAKARPTTPAPAEAPLLLVTLEVEIAADQPEVCADRFSVFDQGNGRHRVRTDRRLACAEDTGLLKADGLAGVPQVGHVVEIDTGDDGTICIDNVDRIQPTAQADFQDHRIETRVGEQMHDRQRGEFEVRQADGLGKAAARAFHRLKVRQQHRVGGDLAIHACTLVEIDQVRRGMATHLVASGQQDRLQHRASRAFAIGQCVGRLLLQERQKLGDLAAHVAAIDDHVDGTFLQQELGALEAFRQLLANGLFDHARAGKPDQRLRFGDHHVAHEREAGGHAAHGRIGQHADERQLGFSQLLDHRRRLRHLHERQQAFLHARATGGRHADERHLLLQRRLCAARETLAHHGAHRAAHEFELEARHDDRQRVNGAAHHDHGVGFTRVVHRRLNAVGVLLRVLELERVDREDLLAQLIAAFGVQQCVQAGAGADAHMAFGNALALRRVGLLDLGRKQFVQPAHACSLNAVSRRSGVQRLADLRDEISQVLYRLFARSFLQQLHNAGSDDHRIRNTADRTCSCRITDAETDAHGQPRVLADLRDALSHRVQVDGGRARHAFERHVIDVATRHTGNLRDACFGGGGRQEEDRIDADGPHGLGKGLAFFGRVVDHEHTVHARFGCRLGKGFDAHPLDRIGVTHEHHGCRRVGGAESTHILQHRAQAHLLGQCALGRTLDHRTIGHRVGKRHAQFDDVGAALDQRVH